MPRAALARMSVRGNIGVSLVLLVVLICSTWAAVKITTERLLYQNATSAARDWAQYLAASVTDLEQIASGQQPSTASMAFFRATGNSGGHVFRYVIFNRNGYSQLVSDHGKVSLFDLSDFSADAATSVKSGQPVVDAKEGDASAEQPSFFATAYVPVIVDHQPIAIVAAYIDQSEQRDNVYKAFLFAAIFLCLTTGVSFLIPMIAWLRRTKEKQQADQRIRFLAHHDVLTGLANRAQFMEKMEKALTAPSLQGGGIAVHFIDLDRFKEVNDSLGHDGGDFLLKTIAGRLSAGTRIDDTVARLGGDEFVVIQTDVHDKRQAEEFAGRLASALRCPISYKGNALIATTSIGIAVAPEDGATSERLLKCADLALYAAKADGRNCVRSFRPEMDAALQARIELERTLRDAVTHERFVLHYQPVFDAAAGHQLRGFEALLRLPREDGTLIPPMEFIAVAEDLRLIGEIGTWVLREACRTAATWPEHVTVAVNLSPAQFELGSVGAIVAAALSDTGLAAHRLELEITETLLLGNSEAILAELRTIKAMGVAIAMDDFGTGYSSLSYLWRFPFDKIKIDRSFMSGLGASGRDAGTVMKTIIALGHELDMLVTVEGVETAQQAAFISGTDADLVQGYFFSKPVSETEVAAALLTRYLPRLPTLPSATAGRAIPRIARAAAE
jgi:diguanylate cyclase (GGDEF)-like protein